MKIILFIVSILLMQGCVNSKFVDSKLLDQELNLSGKSIKAYNTLDIRVDEFGDKMLASLNQQIVSKLERKKVTVTVLNFKDSKIGTTYMVSGSGSVPIDEFVSQYKNIEIEEGVNYRLLMIPSKMTVTSSWRFFSITWILVDASTDLTVWKGVSSGEHLVQFHINEMPEKRAALIADSFLAELEKAKVF